MMKQLVFKGVLLFLVLNFGSFEVKANHEDPKITQTALRKDFSKTINKEFDISSEGEVELRNKYGEINLKTWDQNKVKIDVTITVHAKSESNAQEVFERVDVDFANGRDFVRAHTEIQPKKKSWWGSSGKHDFSIDYEVYMPRSNKLNLSNKYGNTYIEKLDNTVTLEIKYGNFSADAVGNLNVSLGYGNGSIVQAEEAQIEIKYSKLRLKSAKDVFVDSKYSKIYIDNANDVNSESSYDHYELGEVRDFKNTGKYDHFEVDHVDNIKIYTKYTNLSLDKLSTNADIEMQHGGTSIHSLEDGFGRITLVGKYASFKIDVVDNAKFQLDAVTTHAGVHYPNAMNVIYEKSRNSDHEVEGYMGTKGASSVIKARLSYGGLKIY
ncbi:MAG: hypothetical protein AAGG75_17130 [Bacteroidota bacterium]